MNARNAPTPTGTHRRRGVAIAMVVVVLAFVHLAILSAVQASGDDAMNTARRVESARAFYAAEGVTRYAIDEVRKGIDVDRDGVIGSVSDDGNSANDPVVGLGSASVSAVAAGSFTTLRVTSRAGLASRPVESTLELAIGAPPGPGPGLLADYFQSTTALNTLADINWTASVAIGVTTMVNWASTGSGVPFWSSGVGTRFGDQFTGTITIPQAGLWTFRLTSDEGSQLRIDDELVVDHDGRHTYTRRDGTARLNAGVHTIEVRHFQESGNYGLTLWWRGPGVPAMTRVPTTALWPGDDWALGIPAPGVAISDAATITGDNSVNSCFIDAFDSRLGPYGGANVLHDQTVLTTYSSANGKILVRRRATVHGNVVSGPTSGPGAVTTNTNGTITGSRTRASHVVGLPLPPGLPPPLPVSSGNVTLTGSVAWSGTRRYGTLTISGAGTVVTVTGPTTVYTNSVVIRDDASIELAPGATLALIANGNITVQNTAWVNMNTGDPARARLSTLGNGRRVRLLNQANVCAVVRNHHGTLELSGTTTPGSEFFGSFVGRRLTMTQRSRLHADVRPIDEVTDPPQPWNSLAVRSWGDAR